MTSSQTDPAASPAAPPASPRAVLAFNPHLLPRLFGPEALDRLHRAVRIDTRPEAVLTGLGDPAGLPAPAREALAEAELLVTGWGTPPITEAVLAAAPRLRAVVHTAGSVKKLVNDGWWRRGIALASSVDANALPVAEFTVAMVLLSGKRAFRIRDYYREERLRSDWTTRFSTLGNYRTRVGLLSASRIGRRVAELLAPFDLDVSLHDPHPEALAGLPESVTPRGLQELFATSDIVSLHTPLLPATTGLVGAALLAAMPDGATLINTARGGVVDHAALEAELVSGRLNAVLDVTDPHEPLPADSPLWELPNVVLTPHLAGSTGNEVRRLGDYAVEEVERFASGLAFARPITPEELARSA
ncbi:hypothetical protein BIV57_05125 [Mangrovactinospora gilvigrisea]|uniref:Hydroxyacid dehydrogenase n=1 Tax=Mangrovactinospora gilvigrisea TaxID=1428644 RepID=A0A1J7BIQ1_9ACTN|nr:hydroxyacid dehydrogenase [Mangrovactinospora gilvigrisea]OIV38551.1 hypothetical protein BIV57_05125 [Mangrovactinospora gilvigrisea]